MLTRSRFLALALIAALCPNAALAQDDPFSILAPRTEEAVETEAAPELTPPAGAFLQRDAYLAARGDSVGQVLVLQWRIERAGLDGTNASVDQAEIGIGPDFVYNQTEDDRTITDFSTGRSLNVSEAGVRNSAIAAHVHRQMNTFTQFTRNGTLEEIRGPGGATFERFWIEAALGVRASEVDILGDTTPDGSWLLRRRPDTPPIVRITPGETGTDRDAAHFASWLRHHAPIHPDALSYFAELGHIPDRFSFIVFSPSSPDGRRETWILESATVSGAAFPWPWGAASAPVGAYGLPDADMASLVSLGLTAAAQGLERDSNSWVDAANALETVGDPAGAYLVLLQAGHHEGACTQGSDLAVCSRLNRSIVSALGNREMEALVTAASAGLSDPEATLEALRPHLDRGDDAAAAANLLAAQVAAILERRGDAIDLSPQALFLASAQADPAAPMTYWHAGRYAAANNDLETAWMLFDIARSLPAPTARTAMIETAAIENRLRAIAPSYFGADLQH